MSFKCVRDRMDRGRWLVRREHEFGFVHERLRELHALPMPERYVIDRP